MESVTHFVLGTRGIPDARRPHRTRHHPRRTGSSLNEFLSGSRFMLVHTSLVISAG